MALFFLVLSITSVFVFDEYQCRAGCRVSGTQGVQFGERSNLCVRHVS